MFSLPDFWPWMKMFSYLISGLGWTCFPYLISGLGWTCFPYLISGLCWIEHVFPTWFLALLEHVFLTWFLALVEHAFLTWFLALVKHAFVTWFLALAITAASSSLARKAAVAMSSVSWPSCDVSLQCRQMLMSHLQQWKQRAWPGWNWHSLLPAAHTSGLEGGWVAIGSTRWSRVPVTRSCKCRQERHMRCWQSRQECVASCCCPSSHISHSTGPLLGGSSVSSTST